MAPSPVLRPDCHRTCNILKPPARLTGNAWPPSPFSLLGVQTLLASLFPAPSLQPEDGVSFPAFSSA